MAKASGIELEVFDTVKETGDNYAEIRIVFSEFPFFNPFKREILPPNSFHMPAPKIPVEELLFDAIRFTPMSRSLVDGYFITDKDNHITFAVCELSHLPDRILKSLLSECLLRAMGIPELSDTPRPGLVGNWNAANDQAKRTLLDGKIEDGFDERYASLLFEGKAKEAHEYAAAKRRENALTIIEPDNVIQFSEHDLMMLTLLYCASLDSGMDKNQVIKRLYSSDICFSTKL